MYFSAFDGFTQPIPAIHGERRDVLDPVVAMLHLRGNTNIAIETSCPPNLFVETDPLLLKQMILFLANNSVKFVHKGFIRIRADIVNGTVRLYIEDSGTWIPNDKRDKLFNRFQESLDLLNQGTGIGLNLCKSLSNLMGGDVRLDEGYTSGVPSCPGTRFILDLKKPPLDLRVNIGADEDVTENESESSIKPTTEVALPKELSVLFVDDDLMIRKLFLRALKRVAPGWKCDEASNGEAALVMSRAKTYDLLFVDQYMASIQKQLLGSETVRAMRTEGCQAKICGLPANDAEQLFMEAGADCFIFKPFKCEKEELRAELLHVLQGPNPLSNASNGASFTPPQRTISIGAA
jgi:CheY-like chemotaxis protein